MSEQTFKSPNFYEREIDVSGPATTGPAGVPGGVIGTSNKGPAFVPVTVANFNEFSQVFGGLDPMHMGPYAAYEFLKHKNALTYCRVLGAGSNASTADLDNTRTKGTVVNAGFTRLGSDASSVSDARRNGSVQLLVAQHKIGHFEFLSNNTFTDNDTIDGQTSVNLVRGHVMTPDTARILIHPLTSVASVGNGSSLNDAVSAGASGKFKLIISSSLGAVFSTSDGISGVRILTASFDPSDSSYIGKILNTDPEKFYQYQHYLHADFAVDASVAYVDTAGVVAVLSGSSNTSDSSGDPALTFKGAFGSFNTRYTAPQTSYFISQPFGNKEYDLFKFEALDDGEYANQLYKISITNLKASANDANKYGTFNVQIRDWNDTDTTPVVLEQFTNCTLDPTSTNYIGRLIGDRKVFYKFDSTIESERGIVTTGRYNNNSRFVRVVLSDEVDAGKIPANALPFGFRGPSLPKVTPSLKTTDVLDPSNSRLAGQIGANLAITGSFLPPVPHRFKITRGEITGSGFVGAPGPSEQTSPFYYWGVKFERDSLTSDPSANDRTLLNPNIIADKNPLLASYTKFLGISKLDVLTTGSTSDSLHNNKFTLAKVAFYNDSIGDLTSSVNNHMREAAYIRNGRLDTTTYKINDGYRNRITFATLLSSGTAPQFNSFSTFTKFTNFMYGGFDGTNILNRDAHRLNDKSVSFDAPGLASTTTWPAGFSSAYADPSGDGKTNNGVNSYLTAVGVMTDPVRSNNNILAIPGIKEPYINDQAIKKVKEYGLSMYVMDIPSYDDSTARIYDDTKKKPSILKTTAQFDTRAIDNDYAAAYYPDIFVDDATNKRRVKVPASVAALGALAFNDRQSFPWFAPAGFNRAALDFVTNIDVRLNVADRDRLYESKINPIATFPRLGYVVYGQKTLKVNKSALDRVNVRRLMLELKRIIAGIAQRLIFEQNTPEIRNKFVADASFQLALVQANAGIEAFQVVMNESNNTQADIDANRLNGRIVVVPTRVVEFIAIDFIITNSGVQFV